RWPRDWSSDVCSSDLLLRGADVVIYDRLVHPDLLAEAPREALRVFAGKRCGSHGLPQGEINALLVAHARRGARVVRLKGGDPFRSEERRVGKEWRSRG